MPGFVIHLAVAKKYLENHPKEVQDLNSFQKGVIAPDLNADFSGPSEDKSKSHYGKWGNYITITNWDEFFQDPRSKLGR